MGKKQHQSDKLYLTTKEWTYLYGGKKQGPELGDKAEFRRFPFFCCSISLQPFEHPLCTENGVIFDLMNIVPYVKKYAHNPITGKPLDVKSLIKLNFSKNCDGKYHCPVTYKVFTDNTHIVAIRPTGNVFSMDAVQNLNIKPKNFKDLITDEPFTRNDIITIQDPSDLQKFNISSFHFLKNNLRVVDEAEEKAKKDPKYRLKNVNAETKDILQELDSTYKAAEAKPEEKEVVDSFNAAHYSTGMVAAGFTSTAMEPKTKHETAIISNDIVRYTRVKKKGYVRLITNFGHLNIELHCDMVPKTCENFIKLCENGYYNGITFHRSIRNFMIQGGDPTGTGKGGESIWKGKFKDEFKPNLTHAGRGILSMANSGPNTNTSQFFITYRSCHHLDNKHSVFGLVVGGLDVLNLMEKVEVDDKDRPKKDIRIENTQVFVNPYDEVDEELKKERENERQKEIKEKELLKGGPISHKNDEENKTRVFKSGVGKYLNPASATVYEGEPVRKKMRHTRELSDFSSW